MQCMHAQFWKGLYHFRVKAMVCDGASSNLSLLKVLAEYMGTKLPPEAGVGMDQFLPRMKFTNPYHPDIDDIDVFMIICPSHQVQYENKCIIIISLSSNQYMTEEIN